MLLNDCMRPVSCLQLLMEHHKEHWVMVRTWHQANLARDLRRWERRLDALLPALQPGMPSPHRMEPALGMASPSFDI